MNRTIRGIVVKERQSGEKGKLLFVLTQDEGVVFINATGARNISASYLKSAQLFAYSEFTVYDKQGRLTLTEAALLDSFYELRKDLPSFALASYMAELAYLSAVPADDGILRLVLNCLYALTRQKAPCDIIKAVFEYRLCLALGQAPDFSGCSSCGKKGDRFDFSDPAFYCETCFPGGEAVFLLADGVPETLSFLNGAPSGKILSFKIKGEGKNNFIRFCEDYLVAALDLRPAALDFYKEIAKNHAPGETKDH